MEPKDSSTHLLPIQTNDPLTSMKIAISAMQLFYGGEHAIYYKGDKQATRSSSDEAKPDTNGKSGANRTTNGHRLDLATAETSFQIISVLDNKHRFANI